MTEYTADIHQKELQSGNRFAFGENWAQFLTLLDDERVNEAVNSLKKMLEVEDLHNKTFLDIGSGSGLFSLAARKLGAKVYSFDYDPQSVACTQELKNKFFPNDADWHVEIGSVLDADYMKSLGTYDIVYSWGVLHHTGDMWTALNHVADMVKPQGKIFISLYNDQGWQSKIWWMIKKSYVSLPKFLRWLILIPCYIRLWGPKTLRDLLLLKPQQSWNSYKKNRGMSPHRDVIDWVGGFPFEVSKPEQIFYFYKNKGFTLCALKTCAGGLGCNEFIFQKIG